MATAQVGYVVVGTLAPSGDAAADNEAVIGLVVAGVEHLLDVADGVRLAVEPIAGSDEGHTENQDRAVDDGAVLVALEAMESDAA